MPNLLQQTLDEIAVARKTPAHVSWVGSKDGRYALDWPAFAAIADVEYDDGHGSQEIAAELVVVFDDGSWLQRGEYDGAEWWDYCATPQRRADARPFTQVTGGVE